MMFQAILIPVFVQVALTFGLVLWGGWLRTGDLRSGAVKPDKIALREPGWPARTTQVGCAFSNQLEVPVLFYVLVAFLMIMRHADVIFVALAWLFVAARIVHAAIHVTSNVVTRRGQAYAVSVLILFVMWVIFAVEILTGT
jgi:hypothetical protein